MFGEYDGGDYSGGGRKKKKKRRGDHLKLKNPLNETDIENLYSADPSISILITFLDKLDLINNLNSIKLLAISEAFEKFPNEAVDVD